VLVFSERAWQLFVCRVKENLLETYSDAHLFSATLKPFTNPYLTTPIYLPTSTTATTFCIHPPLHPYFTALCHLLKMPPKASKAAADSKSKATTKAMPKSSAKATPKTKTRGVEKKKKGTKSISSPPPPGF
jgi:hypothetical protein